MASVILNRVAFAKRRGRYWWGNDVKSVCLKPAQFSCWNANDPNRKKLLALSPRDPAYRLCKRIAKRALAGNFPTKQTGLPIITHMRSIRSGRAAMCRSPRSETTCFTKI